MARYVYDNGVKREMTEEEIAQFTETEEVITDEERISALEDALAELIDLVIGGE